MAMTDIAELLARRIDLFLSREKRIMKLQLLRNAGVTLLKQKAQSLAEFMVQQLIDDAAKSASEAVSRPASSGTLTARGNEPRSAKAPSPAPVRSQSARRAT